MNVSPGASLDELQRLYEARYSEYLRVATAITGGLESGRDAVHDAFVNVVRSRSRFRREGPLAAWVWRAVVRSAMMNRADDRAQPRGDDGWSEIDTTEPRSLADEIDTRAAISALPQRQRIVLFLRYYADLDYGSIADVLSIAPGTVGATLHAAQMTLRRNLQEVTHVD